MPGGLGGVRIRSPSVMTDFWGPEGGEGVVIRLRVVLEGLKSLRRMSWRS